MDTIVRCMGPEGRVRSPQAPLTSRLTNITPRPTTTPLTGHRRSRRLHSWVGRRVRRPGRRPRHRRSRAEPPGRLTSLTLRPATACGPWHGLSRWGSWWGRWGRDGGLGHGRSNWGRSNRGGSNRGRSGRGFGCGSSGGRSSRGRSCDGCARTPHSSTVILAVRGALKAERTGRLAAGAGRPAAAADSFTAGGGRPGVRLERGRHGSGCGERSASCDDIDVSARVVEFALGLRWVWILFT
eukprot:270446-Amorphochlora_amoeboformis.AAC.1